MRVTAEMLKAAKWTVNSQGTIWRDVNLHGPYTFHEAAAIYKQQREKK